jgi:hypothetical protein
MKPWKIAVAAAGLLAAFFAVPVQASTWCRIDPALTLPGGFTIYVTEGVLGSQHEAILASSKVTYSVNVVSKKSVLVTVDDYIPTDSYGSFPTEMIVSSMPFGAGTVYGSASGMSGSTMEVVFSIDPKVVFSIDAARATDHQSSKKVTNPEQ